MLRRVQTLPIRAKLAAATAVLILGAVFISCGGKSATGSPQPLTSISGPWEFIAVSNNTSLPWTGIEVALQEGQTLVNGVMQPNGQITASGTQIAFVSLVNTPQANINATGFGGNCEPVSSANSLGPATVTSFTTPVNFAFSENGYIFNVAGSLSGDGKTLVSGTYTAQSGNTCMDSGGMITGTVVNKLAGTYAGAMCPLAATSCSNPQTDFTDTATATLSESSSNALTLNLVLQGTDNTNFTLTGPVTANSFSVQGTFQGQIITYYGYYESYFDPKLKITLPAIYLVNAANGDSVGTFEVPQITGASR